MKTKNYTLFNSQWWMNYSYEDYKRDMLDNGFNVNEEGSEGWWYDINQKTTDDWDDMFVNLKYSKYGKEKVMILGSIGKWNGTFDVEPIICDDIMTAIEKCSSNADDVEVNMVDGHIEVIGKHHDGNNHFEIHFLSQKGYREIERQKYTWLGERYNIKSWWFRKIVGYLY